MLLIILDILTDTHDFVEGDFAQQLAVRMPEDDRISLEQALYLNTKNY